MVAVTGVDADLHNDPGATIGTGTRIAAPFATKRTHPGTSQPVDGLPVATAGSDLSGPYQMEYGTSLSTAIVSGVVALIHARYPQLDAANVINRLIKTATPEGGTVPNNHYGYGVVNALKAVTAKVAAVTANPLGTLVPGGSSSAPATDASSQPSAPVSRSSSAAGPATSSPAVAGGSSGSSAAPAIVIGVIAVILVAAIALWVARRNRTGSGNPPHR